MQPFTQQLYQKNKLKGGHIILLNSYDSPYYEETEETGIVQLYRRIRAACRWEAVLLAENARRLSECRSLLM